MYFNSELGISPYQHFKQLELSGVSIDSNNCCYVDNNTPVLFSVYGRDKNTDLAEWIIDFGNYYEARKYIENQSTLLKLEFVDYYEKCQSVK